MGSDTQRITGRIRLLPSRELPAVSRLRVPRRSDVGPVTDLVAPMSGAHRGHISAARANGIRCGVGVPIVVAGRVWGSIVAWSTERLPDDFEARLDEFTELLAAAISNAEATEALE